MPTLFVLVIVLSKLSAMPNEVSAYPTHEETAARLHLATCRITAIEKITDYFPLSEESLSLKRKELHYLVDVICDSHQILQT